MQMDDGDSRVGTKVEREAAISKPDRKPFSSQNYKHRQPRYNRDENTVVNSESQYKKPISRTREGIRRLQANDHPQRNQDSGKSFSKSVRPPINSIRTYQKRQIVRTDKSAVAEDRSSPGLSRDSLVCPICVEKFDELELRFYPCPCGYRVCAMCIHLIREKTDAKCPNCRELYAEDRQRLAAEIDKGIAKILRQVSKEEERLATKKQPAFPTYRPKRPIKHSTYNEKRLDPVVPKVSEKSTKESTPIITPAPEIKLTRFSGGLSVWD
jgi:hypothetical protein